MGGNPLDSATFRDHVRRERKYDITEYAEQFKKDVGKDKEYAATKGKSEIQKAAEMISKILSEDPLRILKNVMPDVPPASLHIFVIRDNIHVNTPGWVERKFNIDQCITDAGQAILEIKNSNRYKAAKRKMGGYQKE